MWINFRRLDHFFDVLKYGLVRANCGDAPHHGVYVIRPAKHVVGHTGATIDRFPCYVFGYLLRHGTTKMRFRFYLVGRDLVNFDSEARRSFTIHLRDGAREANGITMLVRRLLTGRFGFSHHRSFR